MQGERHPNGTSRTISTRSRIRSAAACSKGVVTSNLEPGANIGTQASSPSGMFAPNYKTPRALQMTGVGFGYAPMLSSLKATSPAPANSRSPNTTIARRLRQNAMRGLNITCPAAIVTVDEHGFIELANVAAVELMAPRDKHLIGQPIAAFLPELHHALRWEEGPQFRTSMQCRAHRGNGESFLADVWFSSYKEGPSPKLAAIIADVTEERGGTSESTSAGSMTLPSECVSLNRPGFEDLIHPRHRRVGGNVEIGFIDFQGLWEGGKTSPSFSGLSANRHFHGLLRSPRTLRRRSSP